MQKNNLINVVLAGGGVKGIAYIGVFEVAEQKGFKVSNIAGVSAGALAGSIVASGYNSFELKEILNKFDLGKIEVDSIPKKSSDYFEIY